MFELPKLLRRPIQDNVEEASSGVKGENSVKLFGNDLAVLQREAGAQCADGSWSFSEHRRGTCSHHGGVASQ